MAKALKIPGSYEAQSLCSNVFNGLFCTGYDRAYNHQSLVCPRLVCRRAPFDFKYKYLSKRNFFALKTNYQLLIDYFISLGKDIWREETK